MQARNLRGPAGTTRLILCVYIFVVLCTTAYSWWVYEKLRDQPLPLTFDKRPFFEETDRFHDLTNYVQLTDSLYGQAAKLGHSSIVFNYPPPAAFVYKVLLHTFPGHTLAPYLWFLGLCSLGFAVVTWFAAERPTMLPGAVGFAIAVTAIIGYPLLFTADRGNIEGVVWALAAAGLCCMLRYRYMTGAVLIGMATAIKPFSALYMLLLLARRRYREPSAGAVVCGVLVLASLIWLGPNPRKAYKELSSGMQAYMQRYVTNIGPLEELRSNHSLLDGMKTAALTIHMHRFDPVLARTELKKVRFQPGGWSVARSLARVYPVVMSGALAMIILVFRRARRLNQLTAVAVAVTLIPFSAADYTLLHLYVPFGAWVVYLTRDVATGRTKPRVGMMFAMAVIYGLLFAPLSPLMLYASFAKTLLLIALLVVCAMEPMKSSYFDADLSTTKSAAEGAPTMLTA